jgi:hypothetical protein
MAMRARSLAIGLVLVAACGPMVGQGDPPPLAAAAPADTNPPVMTDSMIVAGVDTVWSTDSLAATTAADAPRGDPEPRPGAVGCTRTDAPRPVPASAVTENIGAGARFSCVLREGHPPIEALVDADDGYVEGARISAPAWERPWSQSLDAEAIDRPYVGAPVVAVIDYDKDGWGDLRMREWSGATGNRKYHVFRFDPRRQRFARDSVLSELTGAEPLPGRPCVQGYLKNGGRAYDSWTRCLERGRWVVTESESQDNPEGKPFYVRVSKERRGGRMVVVRTDTLTADEVWGGQ